jgi:hypothetical protein
MSLFPSIVQKYAQFDSPISLGTSQHSCACKSVLSVCCISLFLAYLANVVSCRPFVQSFISQEYLAAQGAYPMSPRQSSGVIPQRIVVPRAACAGSTDHYLVRLSHAHRMLMLNVVSQRWVYPQRPSRGLSLSFRNGSSSRKQHVQALQTIIWYVCHTLTECSCSMLFRSIGSILKGPHEVYLCHSATDRRPVSSMCRLHRPLSGTSITRTQNAHAQCRCAA